MFVAEHCIRLFIIGQIPHVFLIEPIECGFEQPSMLLKEQPGSIDGPEYIIEARGIMPCMVDILLDLIILMRVALPIANDLLPQMYLPNEIRIGHCAIPRQLLTQLTLGNMVKRVFLGVVPPQLEDAGVLLVVAGVVPLVQEGYQLVALLADRLVGQVGEFGLAVDELQALKDFAGVALVFYGTELL